MSGIETLVASAFAGIQSAATAATSAVSGLAPVLQTAGTIASVAAPVVGLAGVAQQNQGALEVARANRESAEIQAKELERVATSERAAAQRRVQEQQRRTRQVVSRQRAVAAASGGGVGGTVLDLMADTEAQGKYIADTEQFLGDDRAQGYRDKAAATRYRADADYRGTILENKARRTAGYAKAAGSFARSFA